METIINRIDPISHPGLHRAVDEASETLGEVLGQSAKLVKAEWSVVEGSGPSGPRTVARLRLEDPSSGSREATFSPEEFRSPDHLWWRLHSLWGDLLQQQSRVRLERLERLVGELEKD